MARQEAVLKGVVLPGDIGEEAQRLFARFLNVKIDGRQAELELDGEQLGTGYVFLSGVPESMNDFVRGAFWTAWRENGGTSYPAIGSVERIPQHVAWRASGLTSDEQ